MKRRWLGKSSTLSGTQVKAATWRRLNKKSFKETSISGGSAFDSEESQEGEAAEKDETELLRNAIALSLEGTEQDEDEEDLLRQAIALSLEDWFYDLVKAIALLPANDILILDIIIYINRYTNNLTLIVLSLKWFCLSFGGGLPKVN